MADAAELMKRALDEIRSLRAKLADATQANAAPIAIIGAGCRFPGGADSPEAFWSLLREGRDAIGPIPAGRWDVDAYYDPDPSAPGKMYVREGGFLDGVDQFDPRLFGLSAREAAWMDPQQRLLLEVCWEALERSGYAPDSLMGSRTGVFAGISSFNYASYILSSFEAQEIEPFFGTGNALSVVAGRLSYTLGLTGPALAVDTACSSSLAAVHLACESLRRRECDTALAGGVGLILTPETTVSFCKAGMLARDARCKTFDAVADGYVRGEGAGAIVLKRLSDAIACGDSILAVIRGSACNHDGRSTGLTVPNGPAQQAVIGAALENAGVPLDQIAYIEAHGTGTALGDPIELGALGAVFRHARQPVLLGSVKTNLGHLEAAAGIAGLLRVALSMRHGEIPRLLHFDTPTPRFDWKAHRLQPVTAVTPWPQDRPCAGVSSFGFSGTNVHVVLERAPEPRREPPSIERPLHVFTLSARSAAALDAQVERHLRAMETPLPLADRCFTVNVGRNAFPHRLAVAVAGDAELTAALRERRFECAEVSAEPKVAFLFSGQGSQYPGMGRELYASQPLFRRTFDECDKVLRGLGVPLLDVLDTPQVHQTIYTQPALFALEYALAQLWRAWGIEPDVVIGHSLGEYAAAAIAGVFDLESGLKLAALRGRLMDALPRDGDMLAVLAPAAEVEPFVLAHSGDVSFASFNGPENVAVSGRRQAIAELRAQLEGRGVPCRLLQVSHAFHSPLMDPALAEFEAAAAAIPMRPPAIPLISNLTGAALPADSAPSPAYWSAHIRKPVQFEQGVRALAETHPDLAIEIGPGATLLGMARRCVSAAGLALLPSLRSGQEWKTLLSSLSQAYVRGAKVDWRKFEEGYSRRRVELPTYPFQRERCWVEPGKPKAAAKSFVHQLAWQPAVREAASAVGTVFRALTDRSLEENCAGLVQVITSAQPGRPLWVIIDEPRNAALRGIARTARLEYPSLDIRTIEIDPETTPAQLADAFAFGGSDLAVRAGKVLVSQIVPAALASQSSRVIRGDAAYWITGGTGAVGLRLAQALAQQGARHLVLTSRSASESSGVEALRRLGAQVTVIPADAAEPAGVRRVLDTIAASGVPLAGVVHAAGTLDDGVLHAMTPQRFAATLRAKAHGAWVLHERTAALPLDFFVLCSSAASVFGAPGQANYAAANASLDALAHHRHALGLPALSINWGPWAGAGMAARYKPHAGIRPLSPDLCATIFLQALASPDPQLLVADADLPALSRQAVAIRKAHPVAAAIKALPPAARRQPLTEYVQEKIGALLGFPPADIPLRQGFFDMGMDSLLAVELRNAIQADLDQPLPSTLTFESSSVLSLAESLESLLIPTVESKDRPEPAKVIAANEPIAVVGIGCRFPGGASNAEAFWELLRTGANTAREVPRSRWDAGAQKPAVPYASFIDGVDQFDAAFFGISPREAARMDPQQRLLLEVCWEALENAGVAAEGLAETRAGVFVGIGQSDYARLAGDPARAAVRDAYDGTGNGFCFAAGRISYALGLQGPSLAVDTACSSSLVAVHLAMQSLRRGESDCALAAGVQLMLAPESTALLTRMNALAPDGRSKPFDASADGYGRGEGCGAVVLKRLSDAQKDRDHILGVLHGSAVNHDGPSSGLTVPNPHAQENLIRAALADANVEPAEIGYVEAHGTGTLLGDPLELSALAAVFAEKPRSAPLRIGSVKANIGHLEAAAGIAGLIKTLLTLERRELPPSPHLQNPNPRIPWAELPIEAPREAAPWTGLAGVSSFSLSGANAHLIVGPAPDPIPPSAPDGRHCLVTLSAKTPEALRQLAACHRDHWNQNPTLPFAGVCFTLNAGRSHLPFRLCFAASSLAEAGAALEAWLAGAPSPVMTGHASESRRRPVEFAYPVEEWREWGVDPTASHGGEDPLPIGVSPRTADRLAILHVLAELYVNGFPIRWDALHPDPALRRIPLPTYPFERQRHWLPEVPKASAPFRKIESPFLPGPLFEAVISSESPALLADHRIHGEVVVPAAYHLSVTLGAAREVLGDGAIELTDVSFPAVLALASGESAKLQIALRPESAGAHSFTVVSQRDGEWITHAQGRAARSHGIPATVAPLESAAPQPSVALYDSLAHRGIQLGPAFRWVSGIRAEGSRAVCRMLPPAGAAEGFAVHPGLLDSCFQLLGAVAQEAGEETYIPFHVERLYFAQPSAQEDLHASAALRSAGSSGQRTGDIQLTQAGAVALAVEGLTVRRHSPQTGPLYEIVWREVEPSANPPKFTGETWLILGDGGPVTSSLNSALAALGARTETVTPEQGLPADLEHRRLDGIVHLWSLNARDVQQAETLGCSAALELLRRAPAPRRGVYLITRGAQQVSGESINPLPSLLWGMQPVFRREHPEWSPCILDLDPSSAAPVDWAAAFEGAAAKHRIAVRGGRFWTPHFAKAAGPARQTLSIRKDRSYLITGGLGALGLHAARWLASEGAGSLVLTGRNAPGPRAEAEIAKLESAGVRVTVIAADVSEPAEVEALFAQIAAALPPLAGILHAAGVLEDGLLQRQSWDSFRRVLGPKTHGAWNLHQQSLSYPVEFFVCFSSIAALLPSAGQGAYAAGNSFLDALMRFRTASGLPGLSINWGPWSGEGMAAQSEIPEAVHPDEGLRLLHAAAHHGSPQLAAMDLRRLASRLLESELPPILSGLAARAAAPAAQTRANWSRRIEEAGPAQRLPLLQQYLREELMRVLGASQPPPDDAGLAGLGVDSLMALEIRAAIGRDLGKEISVVRFLDGSSIPELAALLEAQYEECVMAAEAADSWVEGEL